MAGSLKHFRPRIVPDKRFKYVEIELTPDMREHGDPAGTWALDEGLGG